MPRSQLAAHTPRLTLPARSPLKITVRDGAGEGGASLLTEDALTVELRAGPPAQLSVEGPGTLEVGTKAALPQLRVRVCDAAGNPTTSETFEVGGRAELVHVVRRPGQVRHSRRHSTVERLLRPCLAAGVTLPLGLSQWTPSPTHPLSTPHNNRSPSTPAPWPPTAAGAPPRCRFQAATRSKSRRGLRCSRAFECLLMRRGRTRCACSPPLARWRWQMACCTCSCRCAGGVVGGGWGVPAGASISS